MDIYLLHLLKLKSAGQELHIANLHVCRYVNLHTLECPLKAVKGYFPGNSNLVVCGENEFLYISVWAKGTSRRSLWLLLVLVDELEATFT